MFEVIWVTAFAVEVIQKLLRPLIFNQSVDSLNLLVILILPFTRVLKHATLQMDLFHLN